MANERLYAAELPLESVSPLEPGTAKISSSKANVYDRGYSYNGQLLKEKIINIGEKAAE